MRLNRARSSAGAFTLIELLVVIAIIAILAAILFPVFAKARERAYSTSCLSNQKQLARAFMLYADDHEERLPRAWSATGGPNNGPRDWTTDTASYLRNTEVFKCPKYPKRALGSAYNLWLAWYPTGCAIAKLKQPSRTCMFSESSHPQHAADPAWMVDRVAPFGWPVDARFQFDKDRHRGGANMGFVDGHAQWVRHGPETTWKAEFAQYKSDTPISGEGWVGGTPRGTYFWP